MPLPARSGPRRAMLHCNHRCGVGRRRKTALAATAMRDDSACSGLRRLVFSLAEPVWCGTTSYDGTGDNLDVLFEGSGSCGGKQRGVSDVRRRPGCLVRCFGGGASCSLSCRQHKERVRSLEWWRMWRGPRAREEASNGGSGEAPRALFCSDSALFFPSDRSCMVATSNEGVYFLCFLYQRRFTLEF